MLSVPLYVLTAFNKKSGASAEAALKYFLFGSVAAAFTLFGISLLYGLSGDLQLGSIAEKLESQPIEPVLLCRAGHDPGGLRLQSGGGAVSFLGAGRV